MSSPTTLPMSNVVDIEVYVSPTAPIQPTFNQGLIIGSSARISAATRIKKYLYGNWTTAMAADGFLTTDPEYIAASLYFSQTPTPQTLWVGRRDLTASPAETALSALTACRAASFEWWGCYVCGAAKADHVAIAEWAQTVTPPVCYFYTTSDADVPTNTAGNVFAALKGASYNRAFGQYATTQSATYPNNAYAGAAAMGVAMGLNTGLANSAFTMKFKTETGIYTEPLDVTSISNIEGNNGNMYLSYGNAYSFLEQGVMANGQFFDEILNLDMLKSDIQYNIMNLLTVNPKIAQTDPGETQLLHAVNEACEAARNRGFLAGGVWNGQPMLNLNTGDPIPLGYLAQAESFRKQSSADRAARKAMPIYLALVLAGSMHSISIAVYVQR